MNWKIKRDFFYAELYEQQGWEAIVEAGFFEDSAQKDFSIAQSINVLCTPLQKAKQNLAHSTKPCVLLSTGAFCPPHQGHIDMLLAAKEEVEKHGYQAIAAYLSPGHKEYISAKTQEKQIAAWERISLCAEFCKNSPLLEVDPWEALFAEVAVNFTDVIYRLQGYLHAHLGIEIPVFYVCGGDNARFALTFQNKGNCVVVQRKNKQQLPYQAFATYQQALKQHKNILWCNAETSPLSSTELREKEAAKAEDKNLLVRVEDLYLQEHKLLLSALHPLLEKLSEGFKHCKIRLQSEQWQFLQKSQWLKAPLLSLDALLDWPEQLRLSRCFDLLGAYQCSFVHWNPQDLEKLSSTSYALLDDDAVTGASLREAERILAQKGIRVSEVYTIEHQEKNREILDLRDFLFLPKNAGLVLTLPNGKLARVPYLYPFVCPYIRASKKEPMRFSHWVWTFLATLHQKTGYALKDMQESLALFRYLNKDLNSSLSDFCKEMAALCEKNLEA